MQGKRKWTLALVTLVVGAVLAGIQCLNPEFVGLATLVNLGHAAGNGWEHSAKAKGN